ncbi:MAG: hypothetical protein KF747_20210 [Nitrospira sp.]|nr:hypothetical protein [Nitrospira sp.]
MRLLTVVTIGFGISLWVTAVLAEPFPLTPGYYAVTAKYSTSNGQESRDRCVTPDHVASPEAVLNYAFAKKVMPLPGHTIKNYLLQGEKLSYEVETPSSLIHVEGTVSATEFSVVRSNTSKSGKTLPVPITLTLTGKRTGNCKGK